MSWILISIISYFLIALEVILDKFLLTSKRVSHPAVYAFYSGALSLGTLAIFAPFGLHKTGLQQAVFSIISGLIFTYGILSLFFAIRRSAASQVIPVVGATVPMITYFLSIFFLEEKLELSQIYGVVILIFGGLLISFDLPLKINKKKFFSGFYFSVLSGILIGISLTWFKYLFGHDNFTNVFVWTRMGLFSGAMSLLLFPSWRKVISTSFSGLKKDKKENSKTGIVFVANKMLGGSGSVMLNYAISLGSVTIVNALVSAEYIFILLFGIIFSLRFPSIFQEKGDFLDIFQKVFAIIIITAGIFLVSMHVR